MKKMKDCSKLFDLNTIYNFVEFDKPLYSIVAKRKTAKLLFMQPQEYLKRISKNFNHKTIGETLKYIDKPRIKKYAKQMKSGDKFPVIYYNKNSSFQEGRHRALASLILKCNYIPVIEFENINDKDFKNIVNNLKNKTKQEIDKIFKKKGFTNGISDLGYFDLQRYIEYNK